MKNGNGTPSGTTGARRKTRRTALLAAASALLAAASALAARETPIHNGRLSTDLNAGGHAVTNLAPPSASSDAATRGYVDSAVANAAPADYAAVSNRAMSAVQPAALAPYAKRSDVAAATNGLLRAESDPTVPAWAKAAKKPAYTASDVGAYTKAQTDAAISSATGGLASVSSVASVSSALGDHVADDSNPHGVTAAQVGALTKAQGDAAYYPKDEGDLWAAWWSGDGFRVTVTNYNVTPSADVPWSRLPSVRFDYRPDGVATNPLVTVWSEETKWTRWRAAFAVYTNAVAALLDLKAGLDWGRTSPTGFDAPEGFIWLDTPATVIAGGLAWQKTLTSEGAFWVLSSNGMVSQFGADGASTNGYFRITDERGNAVFEIVAGDKVTVGADPASVHTWQHTDGRTRLRVVYEIDSDKAPTLYAAKSLVPGGKTDWRALGADGCAALAAGWTGARGAWTNAVWLAEAPASSADDSLFVCATYEQGGETVVKNHAAVAMEKLVFGGKTYTMDTATIDGKTVLTLTEAK